MKKITLAGLVESQGLVHSSHDYMLARLDEKGKFLLVRRWNSLALTDRKLTFEGERVAYLSLTSNRLACSNSYNLEITGKNTGQWVASFLAPAREQSLIETIRHLKEIADPIDYLAPGVVAGPLASTYFSRLVQAYPEEISIASTIEADSRTCTGSRGGVFRPSASRDLSPTQRGMLTDGEKIH